MQPMGGRQLAPKGMRCNGTGRLYGGDVGILYGPNIAGDAFLNSLQEIWRTGDIHWPMNEDARIHHFLYANMLRNHKTRQTVL
jgi:hypothetical protein